MATVVNNPPASTHSNGTGMMIGALFLLIVVAFLFYFGSRLFNSAQPQDVNVQVPEQVDVQVNPETGQ